MSICSTPISPEGFPVDGALTPLAVTFPTAKKISGLGLTPCGSLGSSTALS